MVRASSLSFDGEYADQRSGCSSMWASASMIVMASPLSGVGADVGGDGDEQVVELPTERPPHVDGVVHDELLQLEVAELIVDQGGPQVVAGLALGADRGAAADADD